MEIRHHIGFNTRRAPELRELVDQMGVKHERKELPGGKSALITFLISEASDNWGAVHELVKEHGAIDRPETFFSEEEVLNAEYLRLIVRYETGFPEPRDSWVTDPTNYENFCATCGSHKQISSFHIRSEPNLKGNNFMTFAWADAIFCQPSIELEIRQAGIDDFETMDVLNLSKDEPSKEIVQIKPTQRTKPGLFPSEDMEIEQCPESGERKHSFHLRGIMQYQRSAIPAGAHMVESYEWFGVGSKRAIREVLVSSRFAELAVDRGWKSLRFRVIELVE